MNSFIKTAIASALPLAAGSAFASQPDKNWRLIPLHISNSDGSARVSNLLEGVDGTGSSINFTSPPVANTIFYRVKTTL